MRVQLRRMPTIQSAPSSSGGTDRCARRSGCVPCIVFSFALFLLLVLVGLRTCGGRHVYEPSPGCFMRVSRRLGLLLSCTCVGCCAFLSARDAEREMLTCPPIYGVFCSCFSRPSLMFSCAASVGVLVCRLLRWRSGIRCARKGASPVQSKLPGLWRMWVDGGRELRHRRSPGGGGWRCQRVSLFFFVRPALQPPPLAGSLLCVTRRPTVRRPLVGLSQAALRYPPSPEGLALNPTSAALTARGAREPMGV